MQIDVEHVAKLARLGLSAEEKELFAKQLSAILEYADILKNLDTENIPPTSHLPAGRHGAIPMKNVFREDKVTPCKSTEAILANAPEEEARMFRVPRIVE